MFPANGMLCQYSTLRAEVEPQWSFNCFITSQGVRGRFRFGKTMSSTNGIEGNC